MNTEKELHQRSGSKCELCRAVENLKIYEVPPESKGVVDDSILICESCNDQIDETKKMDVNHWRCLNDSMWSQVAAVQIMAWRILTRLRKEAWAQDLIETLYLDEELLSWAQATGEGKSSGNDVKHLDSNGAILMAGDTVTLTKDLNVKGANFTAKRGTAVRSISLVSDNPEHIEGKVEGQRIVILTKFVKKSN